MKHSKYEDHVTRVNFFKPKQQNRSVPKHRSFNSVYASKYANYVGKAILTGSNRAAAKHQVFSSSYSHKRLFYIHLTSSRNIRVSYFLRYHRKSKNHIFYNLMYFDRYERWTPSISVGIPVIKTKVLQFNIKPIMQYLNRNLICLNFYFS